MQCASPQSCLCVTTGEESQGGQVDRAAGATSLQEHHYWQLPGQRCLRRRGGSFPSRRVACTGWWGSPGCRDVKSFFHRHARLHCQGQDREFCDLFSNTCTRLLCKPCAAVHRFSACSLGCCVYNDTHFCCGHTCSVQMHAVDLGQYVSPLHGA